MQLLTWRKGLFDSNYQYYANGDIKGSLIFNSFNNNARGIALKNYYFKTKGFLHPITTICDEHKNPMGTITYHSWKLKATLTLDRIDHCSWNYTNGWLSQWTLTNHHDKQIHYQAATARGTVNSTTNDELMLLSGLYIREFFSRTMILIIIIILFPIFIRCC